MLDLFGNLEDRFFYDTAQISHVLIVEKVGQFTVDSEMFARTLFSLIFAKSGRREFKFSLILKTSVYDGYFS